MAVSPRPRPTVIPTASAIMVLFDACTGGDEDALGRGILVDTANVGKDIEGGNVGVGRNDEMVLNGARMMPLGSRINVWDS